MVAQAYVLIQTEVKRASEVAAAVAEIKGVTLAENITGPYDVIVRTEARNLDELDEQVLSKVRRVEGIIRSLTCQVVHL